MSYYSDAPIERGPITLCAANNLPGYVEARAEADVDLSVWYDDAAARDDIIYFALIVTETQVPIGEVILHDIDEEAGSAFLHAHVFQAQRRLVGHGYHALKAVTEYAFKQRKLRALTLVIDEENFPARRCYAKCGFEQVDRADDDHSQVIMCLTREGWRRMIEDKEW